MIQERRTGDRRDRDGGYLLVEALATLALSAIVLGALVSLGSGLSTAIDRVAQRVEAGERGRRVVAAIASEVEQIARRRFAGEGARFVFAGSSDRIVFALAPRQPDGLRALVVVAYQSAHPGEALRAEGALPPDAASFDAVDLSRPRSLDLGGELLRFAYVERRDSGEIVSESWTLTGRMPDAVRIDRLDPSSGTTLGSRRVAIVAQAEPGCAAPGKAFCSIAMPQPAMPQPAMPQPAETGAVPK